MERCNKFYSKYQYTDVKTNRWEIINTIPRFLTQETVLSKYYKNSLGLELLDSPSMNAQLEKESKEYLDELGFGDDITINVDSKNIFINKRRINLAPAEVKLFNLLYLKKELIVSYDEISELFWDDEAAERFSLYAISKSISRIRKEIKSAGIKRELIHTQKGQGYMLS
jgi:DNA-binding response OmpR family regulator